MSTPGAETLTHSHIRALEFLFNVNRARSKVILSQDLKCPKSYNKDYLKDLSNLGYILKLPLLEDMREVLYQLSPLGEQVFLELKNNNDIQRTYDFESETYIHAT